MNAAGAGLRVLFRLQGILCTRFAVTPQSMALVFSNPVVVKTALSVWSNGNMLSISIESVQELMPWMFLSS